MNREEVIAELERQITGGPAALIKGYLAATGCKHWGGNARALHFELAGFYDAAHPKLVEIEEGLAELAAEGFVSYDAGVWRFGEWRSSAPACADCGTPSASTLCPACQALIEGRDAR